ncbi:hypothetical protein E27107_280267 [Elizabethkingia anophelis]|nr:hypothetical protein E18064_290267 [Elizabethkingia anophelis]CDN78232.1 hypothetical protein E27107_280267 [Elizabethkingia anophelis]
MVAWPRSQFPINKTVSLLIIKISANNTAQLFSVNFFHNKSFIGELHRYNISANKKNHILKYKLNTKKTGYVARLIFIRKAYF